MFKNTNGRHSLHIVRWAAITIAVMLGLSYVVGFFQHHAPTSTTPAPAHATPAHAGAASPAHASTMAVPSGPITLPPQPMPPGAVQGHAQIALASAPNQQAPWTDLGAAVVTAPTASLTTTAPRALAAVAPSSGIMRLRWRGWFSAQTAGTYTMAASISGGGVGDLALRVDGVASPVLSMRRNCGLWGDCPSTPTTGAGSVALAAGWHQVVATIKTDAGSKADITIYMRAPGASAPVVLMPSWPAGAGGAK
ncbi:hypothetical protein [Metallibacterium sp.]|uniref:hypothetical protein n=1 Tax=Metallibacterium sp. TaxID=2940281 RepID=UPI002629BAF9|nr:hypothetical protein [Metallibacterium sp.]